MKILFVVHYFLPRHQAGTEIYTARLAKQLAAMGHETMVFTSEDGPPGFMGFALEEDSWEGVPVYRLKRGEPPDFQRSYQDPDVDLIFREFLQAHQPDVVHFQHAFRLSAGMITECKSAGVPAALTLADYWFICPPILLLQPGFALCPGPGPEECARCGNAIGTLYSGAGGRLVGKALERAVQAAHAAKRRLPPALVSGLRSWRQRRALADPGSSLNRRKAMIEARQQSMRRTLADADIIIAPSEFLRQKYIQAGMAGGEKIIRSDYGFDKTPFRGLRRENSDHVRFGFIGTPVEHKGLHLAIEAMNMLEDTDAELLVHGDLELFPGYAHRIKRMAKNPGIRFAGRFEHEDIAEVLSGLDAVVVPSLWYENSPLTIHEAFMAGAPVIASDVGGMAELVQSGGGLTFRTGDASDLARVMQEVAEKPGKLAELQKSTPPVKDIRENARELERIYNKLIPAGPS